MVDAGPGPSYEEKKRVTHPSQALGTRKYSSVTRIHFYKEALSTLRN